MSATTPAEVLDRRRQLMMDGDAEGLADLFTPDAVMEFTFHGPPGAPVRLEGREAIRAYSRQVMATALRLEAYEVTELYQTQDPAVVIAEMRAQATLADGQAMTATSIQVLRIQDGRIALVRDFADPRILDKVTGEIGRVRAESYVPVSTGGWPARPAPLIRRRRRRRPARSRRSPSTPGR